MFDDSRLFRRTDPDFPTTRAARQRLVDAGRVEGERPLARSILPSITAPRRPVPSTVRPAKAPLPTSSRLAVPDGPACRWARQTAAHSTWI